ncbi:MAG: hypothetical protein ACFCU6_01495 [Balneolaceae bacterium]
MKIMILLVCVFLLGCDVEKEGENNSTENPSFLSSFTMGSEDGKSKKSNREYILFSEGKQISSHQTESEVHTTAQHFLEENPFVEVYYTDDTEYIRENIANKTAAELYNFTHPSLNNIEWTLKQPLDLDGFELFTKAKSNADSVRITYRCDNNNSAEKMIKSEHGKVEDLFHGDCSRILTQIYAYSDVVVGGYYVVDVGFFNAVDF